MYGYSPYDFQNKNNYWPQPQQQNNNVVNWVQGESGAKSWIVGRGESVLLMDSENPVFYLKSCDNAGMPLPLRVFDYTERTNAGQNQTFNTNATEYATAEQYADLNGKYEELKAIVDGLTKPKRTTKGGLSDE